MLQNRLRGRLLLVVTVIAGSVAMTGCQSALNKARVVSLEEAKTLTAGLEKGVVAPPRTIADITAILDDPAHIQSKSVTEKKRIADSRPPTRGSLVNFYVKRGEAAFNLGRYRQALEDFQAASRALGQHGSRKAEILSWISWAHLNVGNYSAAIRTMRRAQRMNTRSARRSTNLANMMAWTGNLKKARVWQSRARGLMADWGWGSASDRLDRQINVSEMDQAIAVTEGRWAEAEAAARRLVPVYGRIWGYSTVRYLVRSDIARYLRLQGKLVESEIAARDAITFAMKGLGRNTPTTARAATALASTLTAQGRYVEAEQLLETALDILMRIEVGPGSWHLAESRFAMGEVLLAQGRYEDAHQIFTQAEMDMRSVDEQQFWAWYAGDPRMVVAMLMSGRAGEALKVAEESLREFEERLGAKHRQTAYAVAIRAMALTRLGRTREAVAEFRKALPILVSRSRDVAEDKATAKGYLLDLVLEHYLDALGALPSAEAMNEAFVVAERARGSKIERALTASATRATVHDAELAELVRREQDAREHIAGNFGVLTKLLNAPSGQRDESAVEDLKVRIDTLRVARSTLAEEIERKFPEYAALITPKPLSIVEVQAILKEDEALVSIYVGADRTYVWAVPKTGAAAFAIRKVSRKAIDEMVTELRRALDPGAETLGDIPVFNVAVAHQLYETILGPVEAGWKGASSVWFVPHGSLGHLPLSVLAAEGSPLPRETEPLFSRYRDVAWLARTHAVTVLPSVVSLNTLRNLPVGAPARAPLVAFGDPYFSVAQAREAEHTQTDEPVRIADARTLGAARGVPLRLRATPNFQGVNSAQLALLPRLPDTRQEVEAIALALEADPTTSIFVGREASEAMVKSLDLSATKVLVFATHGLVSGDLDGLTQPALALSSPRISGTGGDGLLTMGEILGLRLNADWVVLSACNTAAGHGVGAEAITGLARAFFYAGSRALLVSNWPVHSASAKNLTTNLFRRQSTTPGLSRAEALRQSMMTLVKNGEYKDADGDVIFSYAHPLFWAPFSLVGDGGSSVR